MKRIFVFLFVCSVIMFPGYARTQSNKSIEFEPVKIPDFAFEVKVSGQVLLADDDLFVVRFSRVDCVGYYDKTCNGSGYSTNSIEKYRVYKQYGRNLKPGDPVLSVRLYPKKNFKKFDFNKLIQAIENQAEEFPVIPEK